MILHQQYHTWRRTLTRASTAAAIVHELVFGRPLVGEPVSQPRAHCDKVAFGGRAMGEPRYNGAFTPLDDDTAAAAASATQATGGFIASFFPKVRPGSRVSASDSAESEAEKVDFNDAGRHNGAFQMSLDPRTEHQIDRMGSMHPITKFIAKSFMGDPVADEKRLAAHIASQEKVIAANRERLAQPLPMHGAHYWKQLRPVVDIHNDSVVRENTYKYAVVHMESRTTAPA